MKTYCASVTGFPAFTDNAKLIKNFHSMTTIVQNLFCHSPLMSVGWLVKQVDSDGHFP